MSGISRQIAECTSIPAAGLSHRQDASIPQGCGQVFMPAQDRVEPGMTLDDPRGRHRVEPPEDLVEKPGRQEASTVHISGWVGERQGVVGRRDRPGEPEEFAGIAQVRVPLDGGVGVERVGGCVRRGWVRLGGSDQRERDRVGRREGPLGEVGHDHDARPCPVDRADDGHADRSDLGGGRGFDRLGFGDDPLDGRDEVGPLERQGRDRRADLIKHPAMVVDRVPERSKGIRIQAEMASQLAEPIGVDHATDPRR